MLEPYIANTDWRWFEFLSQRSAGGRIDEANFWSPRSIQPLKGFRSGEPIFLRLKSPRNVIAGYGFFAHFTVLSLEASWEWFDWKNGDPGRTQFLGRVGAYRGVDLLDPRAERAPLACTILRDLVLWPEERWLPWGAEQGWARNIVRGKTERDDARASRLLAEIQLDGLEEPEELRPDFELVDVDERVLADSQIVVRQGQGAFRARLLDAYGRRCAITGERTEPVLDAAHIQPYLGPRSNHVKNGLLLTKEFHTLFDRGYVTVEPERHAVRVSRRLREDFQNGKRYYEYDGCQLAVPPAEGARPSDAALAWHMARRFLG